MKKTRTQRLIITALMLAIAFAIAWICQLIPFLSLPFGGGFTIASMLPIVVVAYMFGTRWGLLTGLVYAILQMMMGHSTVSGLFMPGSDSYMILYKALLVCLIDYLIAYTALGFGGIFRGMKSKAAALCLGSIVALALRYLAHIVSGAIFYTSWAEWFFGQEGLPLGQTILANFSGTSLAVLYSIVYNGLYMIPEIVITAVAAIVVARIPMIARCEVN